MASRSNAGGSARTSPGASPYWPVASARHQEIACRSLSSLRSHRYRNPGKAAAKTSGSAASAAAPSRGQAAQPGDGVVQVVPHHLRPPHPVRGDRLVPHREQERIVAGCAPPAAPKLFVAPVEVLG